MKATATTTLSLLLAVLIATAALFEASEAVVSCGDVTMKSVSCLAFITGKVAKPAPQCCTNLNQLAKGLASATDRRAVCQCMKNGVKALPGVQDRFLSQIPRLCKIPVGFPVSLNTNCNSIN